MTQSESPLVKRCLAFARVASIAATGVGSLVLVGWLLDISFLKSVLPSAATMKPNTAACFVLAGLALGWLRIEPDQSGDLSPRRSFAARACAAVVALVGLLTLSEYVLNVNLGIDEVLFREELLAMPEPHPGRMAFATALATFVLGMALLFLDVEPIRGHRLSPSLALLTTLIGLIALLGYVYGVQALQHFAAYSSMALHTSALFMLLGVGVLCARPTSGLMATLTSEHGGGWMARHVLPIALTLPFVIGWLRLAGEQAGLYETEFGLALFATSNIAIFAVVIWLNARSLNRLDAQRRQTEAAVQRSAQELQRANERMQREVAERRLAGEALLQSEDRFAKAFRSSPAALGIAQLDDGCILDVNEKFLALTGYRREDVLGRTSIELGLIQPEHRSRLTQMLQSQGGSMRDVELTIPTKSGEMRTVLLSLERIDLAQGPCLLSILYDITERKQAEERLRENEGNARSLLRLSRRLEQAQTYAEALDAALDEVKSVLGYQNVWTYLRSEDKQYLRLLTTTGELSQVIADDYPTLTIKGDRFLEEITEGKDIVVVEDARTDPRTNKDIVAQLGNRTIVNVPIVLMDRHLGAFGTGSFGDEGVRIPTSTQLDYLRALASHMAVTLDRLHLLTERKRSADEAERMAARLRILSEASQEFSVATTDFRRLLDLVARRLSELVGELCAIRLIAEGGEWLETTGSVYHPDPQVVLAGRQIMLALPQRVGEGISGRVAATAQPVLIPMITTAQVAAQTEPKYRPFVERIGISSLLVVPLLSRGRVIGVASLSRSRPGHPYTPDDQRLVQDLADRAALAITNARLLAETQQLNAELEQRVAERTAQLEAANQELDAFAYSVSHDLRAPLRAIDGFSRIVVEDYADKLDAEGHRLMNVVRASTRKMDVLITDVLALSRFTRSEMRLSRIDMTALADSVYQEIASSEVQHKFVFSVAPLPEAYGDPTLLRQVWSNLISNAIKYTLPKDERRIEIGGYTEQGANTYFVKDTGVGFNPDYVHQLFGMFQRLHREEEFEGTGVGLTIVQRIVQRHGGRVWAEGQIDQGATIYFSLPRAGMGHE